MCIASVNPQEFNISYSKEKPGRKKLGRDMSIRSLDWWPFELYVRHSTTANGPWNLGPIRALGSPSFRAFPCNISHCTSKGELRVESGGTVELLAESHVGLHSFLHGQRRSSLHQLLYCFWTKPTDPFAAEIFFDSRDVGRGAILGHPT